MSTFRNILDFLVLASGDKIMLKYKPMYIYVLYIYYFFYATG